MGSRMFAPEAKLFRENNVVVTEKVIKPRIDHLFKDFIKVLTRDIG